MVREEGARVGVDSDLRTRKWHAHRMHHGIEDGIREEESAGDEEHRDPKAIACDEAREL